MIRTSTWQELGVEAKSDNYLSLLQKADLDYDVVAQDLFVDYEGSKIKVPNKQVIMRKDNQEIFGIVSDRYQVCQNREALDFVDYIEGVNLIRAGGIGGFVWMIGALPEVTVLGDKITPHLIFQNSHDGSSSIKTTICMLRIVCQNQFISSFSQSPATISIRHQGELDKKLLVARETMQGVYDYVKTYDAVANELVMQKVTPKKFNSLLEGFFEIPEDASDRTKNFVLERREQFIQAYNTDDNQNFKGTKWGLVNAYSDLITHEEYNRKVNDWKSNRFLNSLSPSTMNSFMKIVEAA